LFWINAPQTPELLAAEAGLTRSFWAMIYSLWP
jgi:hypothetical protein